MYRPFLFSFLMFFVVVGGFSQETFPTNGPADEREHYHVFTNATIVTSPGQVIENGNLVIRDGKVLSVGGNSSVPDGAVVHNLEGKMIYPSFIELNAEYGVADVKLPMDPEERGPQPNSYKKGAYGWNQAVHPEMNAANHFVIDDKNAEQLRKQGFGSALTHIKDGISRGTGAFVALGKDSENLQMLDAKASHHFSFDKGSSTQDYPSSLMGAIALLRQSHYDAQWYKNNGTEQTNLSLQAWNDNKELPAFFEIDDVLDIFRAEKLAKEINMDFILIGNGDEYQKIKQFNNQRPEQLVIPLNFPKAYNVEDPLEARMVSLKEMKHWEMAPYNSVFLSENNVPFSITSTKLEKDADFITNLQKAVKSGLSEENALKALTEMPAKMLGKSEMVGSLSAGKVANFIITDGNLFHDEDSKILENWILGKQYVINKEEDKSIAGMYNLSVNGQNYDLSVKDKKGKLTFEVVEQDSTKLKTKGSFQNGSLSLFFTNDEGRVRLSGWESYKNSFNGSGVNANGQTVSWRATKKGDVETSEDSGEDDDEMTEHPTIDDVIYPFVGYGWTSQPEQEAILFQNATVWTNEEDGILENTDVLIRNGKIQRIGENLSAGGAKVIDASGKHLTAGIVDEHSHISISGGVNEGTQSSSAEVRIGDVVNSEHIGLYRVLAGGVTTSQLLHGSANPIGGQSAIIKSRWGLAPEKMKFEAADEYIKFALGENVKQSNWGSDYDSRFPQTRMGVEQVYENYFTLAQEYAKARAEQPNKTRRNLELEALAEILEKERFITCHSYVQSEINMLMHVAERFGFNVNTFTHILEGYKVADKMKEHGVGGSTFSDWWAYKYEVIDAIPYNAAMMVREGVVTAINSDDAEMARRLNQEAAKTIKYGGLSKEEAWKTVTLNPAKLLHIDDRVGSIKTGKDADLVLWSADPLSIYAIAEQTYVDGRKYFSLEDDAKRQKEIEAERERIIQKMLNAKKKGEKTQPPKGKEDNYYSCRQLGSTGTQTIKHNH